MLHVVLVCHTSVWTPALCMILLRLGVLACYSTTVPDLPPDLREGFLSQLNQCDNPTVKKVEPLGAGASRHRRPEPQRPSPEGEGEHRQGCDVRLQRHSAAAQAGPRRDRAGRQPDLHDPLGNFERASE